jgi:urease accessory protein UreF
MLFLVQKWREMKYAASLALEDQIEARQKATRELHREESKRWQTFVKERRQTLEDQPPRRRKGRPLKKPVLRYKTYKNR